jgi:G6PDH family F420-dependent oxidoreductase
VIRRLWEGGMQSHHGRHYRVEKARIYDLPDKTPPIIISGFGPKATKLAARIGDGFCTVSPVKHAVETFRRDGGAGKVVAGGMKACYDSQEERARATVHRLWPNEALPGELSQILPTPAHFEQACEIVSEEMAVESVPCGPDIERHVNAVQAYSDAGFDELYVGQIGNGHEAFFEAYSREVLPRFAPSGEPSRDDAPRRPHELRK